MTTDFEAFKKLKLNEGFDEVLIRDWQPHFKNEEHTHPFDTEAIVVNGEFWLGIDNKIHHLQAGDRFKVPRNVMHSEKYGPNGAIFWAARKN